LARFQQTVTTVQQRLLKLQDAASEKHDTSRMLGCAKHPLAHALGLGQHMSIAGHGHLLCVWSLEEFLRRLGEIRDLYQEATEGAGFEEIRQRLAANPFKNPWHQPTFADVKLLAEAATSIRNSPILRWLLRSPNLSTTPGREREPSPPSAPSPVQATKAKQPSKLSSFPAAERKRLRPSPLSSTSSTSEKAVRTTPMKAGSRKLFGPAVSEGQSSGSLSQAEVRPVPEVIYEPPAIRSELASAVLNSVLGEGCSSSSGAEMESQGALTGSPSEVTADQRSQDGMQGFKEELAQLKDMLTQAAGSARTARLEQLLLEKLRVSLAETVRGELRSILTEYSGSELDRAVSPEPVATGMLCNMRSKAEGVRTRSPFAARREDAAAAGPTLLGNEMQGSGGYVKAEPLAGQPLRCIRISAGSGSRPANLVKGSSPPGQVRHVIIRAPSSQLHATSRSISPVPGRPESCTMTSRVAVSPMPRSPSPLGPRQPVASPLSSSLGHIAGTRTPQTGWSSWGGVRAPPSPGPRLRVLHTSSSGRLPQCAEPVQ